MEYEYKTVLTENNWKKEVRRRNMFGWRCYSATGITEITHHTDVSVNAFDEIEVKNYDTQNKKSSLSFKRERLDILKLAAIYTLEIVYRLTVYLLWPFILLSVLSVALSAATDLDPNMTVFKYVAIAFLIFIVVKIIVFILAKRIPRALGYDISEQV